LTDRAPGDSGIGKILRLKSGPSEQWIDCVENLKREGHRKVTKGLFETAVISAAIGALKTLPASFHPAFCHPECHFVPEIKPISERLTLVSNDRILFGRVLSIRLGGGKVKNKHGRKGLFGIPFWSGKDTMDRPAARMERIDKKRCLSVLFASPCRRFLCLLAISSDGGTAIASRICPLETICELWQRLFRWAQDQGGPRPAREMRVQKTNVLSRIEGLPAARLKGVDTNSNGLGTDSGFR
jgi:hypothetical protein